MKRLLGAMLAAALLSAPAVQARADDKEVAAVLDKAIAALGGEEKLAKAGTATWKGKGTITFGDNTNPIKTTTTVQGLDKHRAEFEGTFNDNDVKGITVIAGDKGWRKFNDDVMALDGDDLASEKRRAYLQAVPMTILPLKGKDFKVASAPEEKVGDKPAAVLKVTGPDGKDFTLFFDKESGLPVKLVATVRGFQGEDFTQETTFADYKDFGGVKKATKVDSKRDGMKFVSIESSDFKALDAVEPGTFDEPK
ncbi:MAG TPA: hypothetical protein VGH33_02600 [Isosphaeraceae bacterium]|jgi:hypothetical protein